jgi:hypothetical protein
MTYITNNYGALSGNVSSATQGTNPIDLAGGIGGLILTGVLIVGAIQKRKQNEG